MVNRTVVNRTVVNRTVVNRTVVNRTVATIASALAGILMLISIAACGDTPTPRPTVEINPPPTSTPTIQPEPTSTPAPTVEPIPTPTLTSTPAPTPRSTKATAEFSLTISSETTWGEIFDHLTHAEQSCLSEVIGEELEDYLAHYVLDFDAFGLEAEAYSCIAPDKGRKIFTSTLALALEYEGFALSDEEIVCMESWASDKDIAQLVRSLDESDEAIMGFFICIIDSYAELMVREMSMGYDENGGGTRYLDRIRA